MDKFIKIVIMGDSIADCGRARPIGEGGNTALGQGYVNLLDAMVTGEHPEWKLRLVNMGINGNTSRHLCSRWQTDLLDLKPDYALVMIGVNDAWRYFDCPFMEERHVSFEEYEENLMYMEKTCREAGIKTLFVSPFFLEPNKMDPMRAKVDGFRKIMRECAEKLGCPYWDVQVEFDKLMNQCPTQRLSQDRVHPHATGQYIIARTILRGLESILV